ncbi:ABC transporter permease [Streptomyces sp. Ncost-T10-10d]|uniref:ABC transporter permease n=1 Tax=Streptomyces sp. Ncost-T10-10d TaxID=1839774 RepID=UPI00081E8A7B|nr:ABC transporter permease [Streptomyces sp. Ncost-T10-10d]SCF59407.1 Binding-protein-dependent transport system inner membrane component [Streptomyces sp. Ncost-T10-10d]
MTRAPRHRARFAATLAVAVTLTSACVSSDAGETGSGKTQKAERGRYTFGLVGAQPDGGSPVEGGTLHIADYGEARSLSPAVTYATGASGGSALAAVYDVLMRYDTAAKKYEPQLAKSLRSSDDLKTWTLQLRDGPALTVALAELAMFTRVLRGDLIVTLREDYILAARAKGMNPLRILFTDALRPSSFSLVTLLGLSLGRLIGSTVVVEYLFSLPGMGTVVVDAAGQGDYPMVQGAVLTIALIYVVINAAIDLSYGYLDPRTRRVHV